ncbi:hypothetical protein CL617_04660 [archaeon]|nr:hypothetical protein [archaeon]
MRKTILMIFFTILISLNVNGLVINEIHFNPDGSDNNKEFVEIYYDSWINLSGYFIEDLSGSDELEVEKVNETSNYALIVEDGFDFSRSNSTIYKIGAAIGNNLGNGIDLVMLKDNEGKILDLVYYSDDWGGNDGFSLERIDINEHASSENFQDSLVIDGTPGRLNSIFSVDGKCDWKIYSILDDDIFDADDFKFKVKLEKLKGEGKSNVTIKRVIYNSDNEIAKEYDSLVSKNILRSKTLGSYSPNLDPGDGYYVNLSITDVNCDDDNLENNFYNKLIFIREDLEIIDSDDVSSNNESELEIIKINNEHKLEFGTIMKVKFKVEKGHTSKYSVNLFVEDDNEKLVSEKNNIHIFGKFKEETLTLPIILKDNCVKRIKGGKHFVVLEGLGEIVKEEVTIKERECKESKDEEVSLTSSGSSPRAQGNVNVDDIIFFNDSNIESKVIYESKNIKIENYGIYFFALVLIVFVIFVLLKKDL